MENLSIKKIKTLVFNLIYSMNKLHIVSSEESKDNGEIQPIPLEMLYPKFSEPGFLQWIDQISQYIYHVWKDTNDQWYLTYGGDTFFGRISLYWRNKNSPDRERFLVSIFNGSHFNEIETDENLYQFFEGIQLTVFDSLPMLRILEFNTLIKLGSWITQVYLDVFKEELGLQGTIIFPDGKFLLGDQPIQLD